MKRFGLAVVVLLIGCSPGNGSSAIALKVRLDADLASTHTKVIAKGGALTLETICMPIAGEESLDVAVGRGEFPFEIELSARGYADAACTQLTVPDELAMPVRATFATGRVVAAELVLRVERPATELNCGDGLDDDGDGREDCADSDCDGASCRTENACIEGMTCQGGQCLGGAQVTCNTPPSVCFQTGGVCVVSDGCHYPANPGVDCDDSDPCTQQDRCGIDGACSGAPKVCNTPPSAQCRQAIGACVADGGCEYAVVPDADCTDFNTCTVNDRCAADGECVGSQVSCPPRSCATSSRCDADGGCVYDAFDAGTACDDGGVCNGSAACIPPFPFVPTNITPEQIPTPSTGRSVFDCGVTEIDTGTSGAPTMVNGCASLPPLSHASIEQGGIATLVLAFDDLEIATGSTLRLIGARPVILVSMKDITVFGTIRARSGAQDCGAVGAGGTGGGGTFSQSGGGGGGFGSAGATGGTAVGAPVGSGGGVNGGVALRGGCPGGRGGNNSDGRAPGGGAVQLIARNTVFLSGGVITAPGSGGRGGTAFQAGNGGGSGGDIKIEAVRVVATTGALASNGGGGGQQTYDGNGADGRDDATPAAGAGLIAFGGGGDGAAGATAATAGGDEGVGVYGGGGGGGVGRIHINVASDCDFGPGVIISPQATSNRPDAGCP